jgi:hypothetical protein
MAAKNEPMGDLDHWTVHEELDRRPTWTGRLRIARFKPDTIEGVSAQLPLLTLELLPSQMMNFQFDHLSESSIALVRQGMTHGGPIDQGVLALMMRQYVDGGATGGRRQGLAPQLALSVAEDLRQAARVGIDSGVEDVMRFFDEIK